MLRISIGKLFHSLGAAIVLLVVLTPVLLAVVFVVDEIVVVVVAVRVILEIISDVIMRAVPVHEFDVSVFILTPRPEN